MRKWKVDNKDLYCFVRTKELQQIRLRSRTTLEHQVFKDLKTKANHNQVPAQRVKSHVRAQHPAGNTLILIGVYELDTVPWLNTT